MARFRCIARLNPRDARASEALRRVPVCAAAWHTRGEAEGTIMLNKTKAITFAAALIAAPMVGAMAAGTGGGGGTGAAGASSGSAGMDSSGSANGVMGTGSTGTVGTTGSTMASTDATGSGSVGGMGSGTASGTNSTGATGSGGYNTTVGSNNSPSSAPSGSNLGMNSGAMSTGTTAGSTGTAGAMGGAGAGAGGAGGGAGGGHYCSLRSGPAVRPARLALRSRQTKGALHGEAPSHGLGSWETGSDYDVISAWSRSTQQPHRGA
jgi:hypothetical protein